MPNVRIDDKFRPTHDLVLGFDSERMIRPAETMKVIAIPRLTFKPNRLLVPPGMAAGCFLIDRLIIDGWTQWLSPGSIPATAFVPQFFSLLLDLDVAPGDKEIIMGVTNTSIGGLRFLASMHGPRVPPPD